MTKGPAHSGQGDAVPKPPKNASGWEPPAEDGTRDGHAEVLRRLRDRAAEAGSWAAAVTAELQRARLLGLNAAESGGHAYHRMSPAERRAWIAELFRQWHRQGLVPEEVQQTIALQVWEQGGLPSALSDAQAAGENQKEKALHKNL
jgi:hypothetical protein